MEIGPAVPEIAAANVHNVEDQSWNLREFTAADLDGNLMRVFYDFRGDR